jgi:hypothetical protein
MPRNKESSDQQMFSNQNEKFFSLQWNISMSQLHPFVMRFLSVMVFFHPFALSSEWLLHSVKLVDLRDCKIEIHILWLSIYIRNGL